MEKMDPTIKAQWLADLRAGAYQQIQGNLHTTGGFCCLGVLVDQCKDGAWEVIEEDEPDRGRHQYVSPGSVAITGLSESLLDWAGLCRPAQDHLMKMNDDHGEDFPTIADWIEANL